MPDEAENQRIYDLTQQQRKLERDIRDEKRRALPARTSPKLRAKQAELRQLVADNPQHLGRKPRREWVLPSSKQSHKVEAMRNYPRDPRTGKLVKYAPTQAQLDSLVANELGGIRFSAPPTYNNRLRNRGGRARVQAYADGTPITLIGIEIGKQIEPGNTILLKTLIHEEIEARVAMWKTPFYERIARSRGTIVLGHKYIDRVIERFFRLKGWKL